MWGTDIWVKHVEAAVDPYLETLPVDLPSESFAASGEQTARRFVHAYPELRLRADGDTLIWPDGERMTVDDKRPKSFAEALASPDLQDQLVMRYPKGPLVPGETPRVDPG